MKKPLSWEASVEQYLSKVTPYLSEKTIIQYRSTLNRVLTLLEEGKRETLPARIKEEDIEYLLQGPLAHLSGGTKHWYISILGTLMDFYMNPTVRSMKLYWPKDRTVNVDWLETWEIVALMEAAETPLERLVIHLELCLGLRRVEVIRLQLEDCKGSFLHVRGKGRGGGKWRTIPYHPETQRIIEDWVKVRNNLIREAQRYRPNIEVPGNLIIWKRFKKKPQLGSYSEKGNGLDNVTIIPVRERMNMKFKNHTLRRTCGRSLWMADVKKETISKILGHEDTATTLRYIGVNLDDMSLAMTALSDYQKELIKRS